MACSSTSTCPQRHLATAAALVTEALAEPVFPEEEVRRILRNRLAEIEQERASSAHRAARELARTLWDPLDRASRPTAGSTESIGALTRDDLVEFHATRVGPQGATVVVAGDLTGVDVVGVLEATLGTWSAPRHRPVPRPVAPVPAPDAARVVVVDRPGSVQTEIAVGRPGPDRSTPDGWAPYPVLSFVLGGSPSARIDAVLREDKGYTYGIRSSFRPRVAGGSFVTSGSVRSEVTGEAVEILLGILDGARDGFTDAEVRSGRRLRRQDRARSLRHGGCRRRRDRGARPGGAAARLHHAQPARRGRPRARRPRRGLPTGRDGGVERGARRRRRDRGAGPRGPGRWAGEHGCPLSTPVRARS